MTVGPKHRVPFRRRREGRTDYRCRLRLLKSGLPRAVVRKSLNNMLVQIVAYDAKGDRVLVSAHSKELKKIGWKWALGNMPVAYLTGYLAGKRAVKSGQTSVVLDIGRNRPTRGSRLFAALRGLIDAGLEIPHSEDILPDPDRVRGAHISEDVAKSFDEVRGKLEAA